MSEQVEWARLDSCLQKATVETFEMMCFSAAEPAHKGDLPAGLVTASRVEFEGDASGQLCLAVEHETARSMAANFYGFDSEALQDSQVETVVAELTNVICGGMLSLYAPDGSFSLSTPEPQDFSASPPAPLQQAFDVDLGTVLISVALR